MCACSTSTRSRRSTRASRANGSTSPVARRPSANHGTPLSRSVCVPRRRAPRASRTARPAKRSRGRCAASPTANRSAPPERGSSWSSSIRTRIIGRDGIAAGDPEQRRPEAEQHPQPLVELVGREEVGDEQRDEREHERARARLEERVAAARELARRPPRRPQPAPAAARQNSTRPGQPQLGEHVQVGVVGDLRLVDDELVAQDRARLEQVVDRGGLEVADADAAHRVVLDHAAGRRSRCRSGRCRRRSS